MSVTSAKVLGYALVAVPDDAQAADKALVYTVGGLDSRSQASDKMLVHTVLDVYVPPTPITASKLNGMSLVGVGTLTMMKGVSYTLAQTISPTVMAKMTGATIRGVEETTQSFGKATAYTLLDANFDPIRLAKATGVAMEGVGSSVVMASRLSGYSQIGMPANTTAIGKGLGYTLLQDGVEPVRLGKSAAYTLLDDPSLLIPEDESASITLRGAMNLNGRGKLRVGFPR